MGKKDKKYSIELSFEEIELPPFQDILVLGKNSTQGKMGLYKSLEMLAPNSFHFIEVKHKRVEAVFINKRLLRKISSKKIMKLLAKKVFPYMSDEELLKVNLKLAIKYNTFEKDKF